MNKKSFLFSLLLEAGQNECSLHTECSCTCTAHSQEKCKLPTCPEPSQFTPGQQTQRWARQATPFVSSLGGCCRKDTTGLLATAGSFPLFHLDMQIIYHWGLHPLANVTIHLGQFKTSFNSYSYCLPQASTEDAPPNKHPHFPRGFQGLRMHRLSCTSCPQPAAAPGVASGSAGAWQYRKSWEPCCKWSHCKHKL